MSEIDKLIAKWRDHHENLKIPFAGRIYCASDLESRKATIEAEIRLEELRQLNEHLKHNDWADIGSNCCERYMAQRIAELEAQVQEGATNGR